LNSKRLLRLTCAAAIACAVSGAAAAAASATTLNGAGSTLVAPIEAEWAATWDQLTGNMVNYQAVGSGQGLLEAGANQVDFGGSDAPLSASASPCNGCLQLPWALSATGVSFNLGNITKLHLTGPVLAAIYLGQIKNWDDPRITSLNRGTHLPNETITPIHRSDGSGDSYAFTDYLARVSPAFKTTVGTATKPTFPVGPGAPKNAGMVTAEEQTPGSIAYIAVSYLIAHRLPAAAIKNAAGNYETPNLSKISAAAAVVHSVPGNNEIHIVNPPRSAKSAYVISTFTYVIIPASRPNDATLKAFIEYAISRQGQSFGPPLDFAPLPGNIERADIATLSRF
jgi:phosphate transport system substrate-binding protein